MRLLKTSILLGIFTLCLFTAQNGQARQESAQENMALSAVLQHTYINNPQLRAARAELRATHEQLPLALAGYKPTIDANTEISDTNVDGSTTTSNSAKKTAGASFNQPLFRGGRTISGSKEARQTINAARQNLYGTEQQILFNAATAYLNVVRDQSLLELSIGNLNFIKKEHEATRDRFEVGEITKTNVSQSTSRLAGAQADIINARGTLRSSRAVFEEITGLPADNLTHPTNTTYNLPKNLDDAIAWATERNPEINAAKSLHAAAEKNIDGIWGELLPELNLKGSWDREFESGTSDVTTRVIGVTATMPLYEGGATRSNIRAAKETANQRYIQILETIKNVTQKTISAWSDLQAAKAEIHSRKAQVEASAIAREGVAAEARFGERTVLDVLDADQEYLDAQASLVTSERNALVATFSLIRQLGEMTPKTLGFPEKTINYQDHLDNVAGKIFGIGIDPIEK